MYMYLYMLMCMSMYVCFSQDDIHGNPLALPSAG